MVTHIQGEQARAVVVVGQTETRQKGFFSLINATRLPCLEIKPQMEGHLERFLASHLYLLLTNCGPHRFAFSLSHCQAKACLARVHNPDRVSGIDKILL
jgi:hypothetical protein